MRGLSKEIEGCTLAQISDLHIGPRVADEYIIESFRRVKEMIPDFVVFTGDWITYRGPKQFDQLRRVIAHVRMAAWELWEFLVTTTMVSTGGGWMWQKKLPKSYAIQELHYSATRQQSLVGYGSSASMTCGVRASIPETC
jgi:hypothetical protein